MKRSHLLKAAMCSILFSANLANAQMVGGDIFLKGQYVEVGIGHLGYYGSDSAAPAGFHPHNFSTPANRIGFVTDPGMDGWTTGTPVMMGDYFLPGSPFEGWVLEVDGDRCQGYNTLGGTSLMTTGPAASGNNVSYATSGSKVIGTWQGTFDSVDITQITTLDTTQMYFTVKVILTNTASVSRNDIYYMRSLDPDNDQTWPGGGFPTHNIVEYQSLDTTVVSATGYSSSAPYLALGTTDTGATALIYNSWPIILTAPMSGAYSGTVSGGSFIGPIGTDHPGDIAIGLVMYIPHLATVDSAGDSVYRTTATAALHPANQGTLNYFYAFSTAGRDSAIAFLNSTPTSGGTLVIKNVNNNADIKVYPNPSGEVVSITNLTANDRVTVCDLMGRDMQQSWSVTKDGTSTFRYENVPAGPYVLIVTDAGGNMKARMPVRKL